MDKGVLGISIGLAVTLAVACGSGETHDHPLSTLTYTSTGGAPSHVDAGSGSVDASTCEKPSISFCFWVDASTCPPAGTLMGTVESGELPDGGWACVDEIISKGGLPDESGSCCADQCKKPDSGCWY